MIENSTGYTNPFELLPANITFNVAAGEILTLHSDGRITLGENAKPDEAAKEFLKIVSQLYPKLVRKLNKEEFMKIAEEMWDRL